MAQTDGAGSPAVAPETDLPGPGPEAAQVWVEDGDGRAGSADVTRVGLAGEIDLASSVDLDLAGREAIDRGRPVVVDVSRVSFMDSVGVGFIARLIIAGREAGWRPTVVGARRSVVETLTISGVLGAIDLVAQEA
jgi:anti-anti-sigma factor